MEFSEQLKPLWDFILHWSFTPAAIAILALTAWMKSKGFDLGKINFIIPMVMGLAFSAMQMYLAPKIGYQSLQAEFWPAVMLGICTGLQATLWHTLGKNTWQHLFGGKK